LIPKLLVKPETQQMGQQVASALAQSAVARLIREILVAQEPESAQKNGHKQNSSTRLALPE